MLNDMSAVRADLRRFLAAEMAVGAVVNGAITGGIAWLVFSGLDRAPVWGMDGLAVDLLPSTLMPVLMMGLILPVVIRLRRAAGGLPDCVWADLGGWSRLVPRRLVLRAALLALVWVALFVPAAAAALWIGGWDAVPLDGVLAGKALYGMAVGGSAAPFIVLPALAR